MKRAALAAGLALLASSFAAEAQPGSQDVDRAFDRMDRDSRAYISTVRCAQSVGQLRLMGAFGPLDSIGNVGQCVVVRGQFVGVFMALDTSFARPTHFSAVDLSTRRRRTAPVDTAAVIASKRAEWNAEERGSAAFEKADRSYTPFSFRTDGDSIEVWLVPISVLSGKPRFVGGEHVYVYSPDGRTLARDVDATADYRAITVADTGQVTIESHQDMVPSFSEFLLANLVNNTGRSVRIDMRQRSSTLVGRGAQAMWLQQPRRGDASDTVAISRLARDLSADSMRGRGPWTPENERVARRLAAQLEHMGARPLLGSSILVPFVAESHPRDTVFNVIGIMPARGAATSGDLIGITAHLDHLGIGKPNAAGDSIYNGFLDDAIGIGMSLDVARRYAQSPGDRPLVVMFFNLEEQGLLGSKALVARPDARPFLDRLKLLIEVDAGSPAGEALEWQLVGATPSHPGARVADSLAHARGWTTTATAPRPISDFYPFSQAGVPVLFPIPGKIWKGYTQAQRDAAMARFDHYHDPADEWRADFPMTGTAYFADWLWDIVSIMSRGAGH